MFAKRLCRSQVFIALIYPMTNMELMVMTDFIIEEVGSYFALALTRFEYGSKIYYKNNVL